MIKYQPLNWYFAVVLLLLDLLLPFHSPPDFHGCCLPLFLQSLSSSELFINISWQTKNDQSPNLSIYCHFAI
jgi:hypothetical protein